MVIFRSNNIYQQSVIDRLKRKSWERSMRDISDAEIISFNPNPLEEEKEIPEKVEINDTNREQTTKNQVRPIT